MPSHSSLPELRFVCLMAAIYLGLEQLYKLVPDALLKETVYGLLFVEPGAVLVNLLSPGEHAVANGNLLSSSRALLEIVRGCDGSGVLFIALGAVLAFPASWQLRAGGSAGRRRAGLSAQHAPPGRAVLHCRLSR